MHTEILTPAQHAVLDGLSEVASAREFYLAGGTALALRHGHRRSIDFDFFRRSDFDTYELLLTLERAFDDLERLPTGEQTLYLRLRGVTTSFFRYPYPLLEAVARRHGASGSPRMRTSRP